MELFYDHVVDPTVKKAMCRDRILTLADVRQADASAGGSSLSKRGADMLAGYKRAAKANALAKAAKRAKADREDESDSDCPSILEKILRAHCK